MVYWEKQRKIKALYELYTRPVREKHGLTQMEYSILLFLNRNPDYDTASSIVQTGQFTKSHVSAAIKGLKNRGLIKAEYRDNNKKSIHLVLKDQANGILQDSKEAEEKYLKCLFAGFSEEEYLHIMGGFFRICENAQAELQNVEEGKTDA